MSVWRPQPASRQQLTDAFESMYPKVKAHEAQIDALIEGMKQLMDGQAALGEAFEAHRGNVEVVLEGLLKRVEALEGIVIDLRRAAVERKTTDSLTPCEFGSQGCSVHHAKQGPLCA